MTKISNRAGTVTATEEQTASSLRRREPTAVRKPVKAAEDEVATAPFPARENSAPPRHPRLEALHADATEPRPRASLLATLSLLLGVTAVLAALTGVLTRPGVLAGVAAAVLGLGGLAATRTRHVTGRTDALLGTALGLAAVTMGILALTGSLPWHSGDSDQVVALRDWLEVRLPWLFATF